MPKADQTNIMPAAPPSRCGPKQSAYYVAVAATQAASGTATAAFMDEVRSAARYLSELHKYTVKILAAVTGLHKNSLLRLTDLTWVPQPETLQQLDMLIVRAEAKRCGEIFPGETAERGPPRKKRNC